MTRWPISRGCIVVLILGLEPRADAVVAPHRESLAIHGRLAVQIEVRFVAGQAKMPRPHHLVFDQPILVAASKGHQCAVHDDHAKHEGAETLEYGFQKTKNEFHTI